METTIEPEIAYEPELPRVSGSQPRGEEASPPGAAYPGPRQADIPPGAGNGEYNAKNGSRAVVEEAGATRGAVFALQMLEAIPGCAYLFAPESLELLFCNRQGQQALLDSSGAPGEVPDPSVSLYHALLEHVGEYCLDPLRTNEPLCFELALNRPARRYDVRCAFLPPFPDEKETLLVCARDITAERAMVRDMRRLAESDPLTGLPGRARCRLDVERAVQAARQSGRTGYLLFAEPREAEAIALGYGADYADALLVLLARYFADAVPPPERGCGVFRWGGNAFVLLLTGAVAAGVQELVAALLGRGRQPWYVLDQALSCPLCVGVAAFPGGPDEDTGADALLKNAAAAAGEARLRESGFVFYEAEARQSGGERAALEAALRADANAGLRGFFLLYQPVVDLNNGCVTGAEALLRWQNGGRLFEPALFLPLAERLGMGEALACMTLARCCGLLAELRAAGRAEFTLSVNLSARQLDEARLLARVGEALNAAGANTEPPGLLLEISEELPVRELDRLLPLCHALRRLGAGLVFDNCGVGGCSLRLMRDLPAGVVKIGRAALRAARRDRYARALIRNITDFAHSLGRTVCMVGVESRADVDYCKLAGVDRAQGWFYHRPMEREQLLNLLEKQ